MVVIRIGPHPLTLQTPLAVALTQGSEIVNLPGERERRVIPVWSSEARAIEAGAGRAELRPALAIAETMPIGWSLVVDPTLDPSMPSITIERLKGHPARSVVPALAVPRDLNLRIARVASRGYPATAPWFPGRTTLPMKSFGGGAANVVIAEDEADARRLAGIARAQLGDRYCAWQIVVATPDEIPQRVR